MKFIGLLLVGASVVASSVASPDPRAKEVDWSSKDIEVISAGNEVRIVLHTGGTTGRRLIQTKVDSHSEDSFTTLAYQIIQNFAETQRSRSSFDVTWTMPKEEFTKLRAEKKFCILHRDDVFLTADEVQEIQNEWKTHR